MIEAMIDPLPPFTFCCPQAIVDQDAGVSIPNLISLLPLDEAPVHVHRFAARVPCDSKGSECQCGIHTAETASALQSRKTERAAKEKPTPISQFFSKHLLRHDALLDALLDAGIDPWPPFTFCCPQA